MSEFDLDPEDVRRLGHRAADLVAEQRASLLDRPVFGKVGAKRRALRRAAARGRASRSRRCSRPCASASFPTRSATRTRASSRSSTRPPTRSAASADYLASAMNSNCWGGDHAAIHVEAVVVRWLAAILGFPPTAEGILT